MPEEDVVVAEAHVVASRLVEWFRTRLLTADAARDAAVDARVAAEDDRREAETRRGETERRVIEVEQLLSASEELAERLETALESRIVIEQAKGYLAARHGVTPGVAFEALRHHARTNRAPLRDVAAEVLTGLGHVEI